MLKKSHLLISSILVLGVQAAFRQAHHIYEQSELYRPVVQQTRYLVEMLRDEVSGIYLPPKQNEETEDQIDEPPLFLSKQGDTLILSFYTLTPAYLQDARFARPARVSYRFARHSDMEKMVLIRREQPASGEALLGLAQESRIADDLKALTFEVYDRENQEWKSDWQSDNALPAAIRLRLLHHSSETETTGLFVIPAERATLS